MVSLIFSSKVCSVPDRGRDEQRDSLRVYAGIVLLFSSPEKIEGIRYVGMILKTTIVRLTRLK